MTIPRIMLDLETLSSRSNAVIVSIGAVPFDPVAGVRHDCKFYEVLSRGEQVGYGRHIDPATVDWWLQQSPEAQKVFKVGGTLPEVALEEFSRFVRGYAGEQEVQIWGYGSTFDNVVLGSLYSDLKLGRPWKYRGDMCHRTLVNLAKGLVEVPARTGTHHNALDDAVYQAECAVVAMRRLGVR